MVLCVPAGFITRTLDAFDVYRYSSPLICVSDRYLAGILMSIVSDGTDFVIHSVSSGPRQL